MRLVRTRDGDVIYRAGDPAAEAYLLCAGRVSLGAGDGGRPTALLGPGSAFGAVEILTGGVRPVSARAEGAGEIAVYTADELCEALLDNSGPLNEIVAAALASRRPAAAEPAPAPEPPQAAAGEPVRLKGLTPLTVDLLGAEGVDVGTFPFVVGRRASPEEGATSRPVTLVLSDARPYQLSRAHFMIDLDDDGVVVRDCGSYNGTIVNGTLLGQQAGVAGIALRPGSNEIVAGLDDSPFRFDCIVPG